jgi:hypothetical protein
MVLTREAGEELVPNHHLIAHLDDARDPPRILQERNRTVGFAHRRQKDRVVEVVHYRHSLSRNQTFGDWRPQRNGFAVKEDEIVAAGIERFLQGAKRQTDERRRFAHAMTGLIDEIEVVTRIKRFNRDLESRITKIRNVLGDAKSAAGAFDRNRR